MRGRVLAPLLLLVLPLLGVPSASAAPALCAPEETRGGVPESFPVDACVDGTTITLRNDRDRPVLVTSVGDVGVPVRIRSENSDVAAVIRRTGGAGEVLLPGEVARWPIGSGLAVVTVQPAAVPAAPELATVLGGWLAGGTDQPAPEAQQHAAALVAEISAALDARAACAEDQEFLTTAGCDVVAAIAIGNAAAGHLDGQAAAGLLPQLLDPASWADWSAVDPEWPAGAAVALSQLASPPPVPPVVPAPAEAAPVAAPVRAPAPEPPPVAVPAVSPQAVPSPAPAPPPDLSRPAVEPPRQQVHTWSWQELRDRDLRRLRELAAAWEQAVAQEPRRQKHREPGDGSDQEGHR